MVLVRLQNVRCHLKHSLTKAVNQRETMRATDRRQQAIIILIVALVGVPALAIRYLFRRSTIKMRRRGPRRSGACSTL